MQRELTEEPPRDVNVMFVNLLYLVSMLLVLLGSAVMPGLPSAWALLMREFLFILLPAFLFLYMAKLPARGTLRLRWPGVWVAVVALLLGVGIWLVDTWLSVTLTHVLGYTIPLPPDFFPTTPGQALLLSLGLVVAAPLCEEVLFRGLIQRGYEQRSPRVSIIVGGLLFVVFHLSLAQGLALLPIAFLLGYVAWRSDSLLSSIFVHFANNALAAVVLVVGTADPNFGPWIGTLPAGMFGVAMVAIGLWVFRRLTSEPEAMPATVRKHGFLAWLARAWPLFIAIPVYLFMIGMEALLGLSPEALALGRTVELGAAPWNHPVKWAYEVRNVLDEPVGQMTCSLVPEGMTFVLTCHRQQSAYEADTGSGIYYGDDVDEHFTARWQQHDLHLLSFELGTQGSLGSRELVVLPRGDTVQVTISAGTGPVEHYSLLIEMPSPPLPEQDREVLLLEYDEWPWRLSALPFQVFYAARSPMLTPYILQNTSGDGYPVVELTYVTVLGAEPIATPAGAFIVWRVQVGDKLVAWYHVEPPYTLVAFDNSIETWELVSVDQP